MPAHFSRMRHVVCHVDYIEVPWYLLHHHVKPFILQWHTFVHIWQLRLIIPQYSCLLYLHLFLCLNSWISQERLVAVVQYLSCLLLYYSLFTFHMVQFKSFENHITTHTSKYKEYLWVFTNLYKETTNLRYLFYLQICKLHTLKFYPLKENLCLQPIFVPLLILHMVLPAFTSYISTSSISFCPYITSSNQVSHKVVVNE